MGFVDPFPGYSLALRAILFVAVPAFMVWQVIRLRRALHVFQLEGYKPARFISWCRERPRRALFIEAVDAKRPLVLTGRAWRILVTASALCLALILGSSGVAHLSGGWPYDITTWAVVTIAVFLLAPLVLVAADRIMAPVQWLINERFRRRAQRTLRSVAPLVVGVTGSFGKTSTKFAIAGLIGRADEVLATPSSFNTPLGVCRAVNEQLNGDHRFLVVEMGAYAVGDIRELAEFVRPTIGVLTAIGPAHLERFGSLDAIRRAKYELIEALPADGVAVMNCDDPEVRGLADRTEHVRVVRYGSTPQARADVTVEGVDVGREGMALEIVDRRSGERLSARTSLLGSHAVGHVLAGVAVATCVGRRLEELAEPIASLRPAEHRLQLIEGTGGVTVIDDAYNSNPAGAAVALEVLAAMPGRRKVVVTPGIVELGPAQFEANQRLGELVARSADSVIVVARVNRDAITQGARRSSTGTEVIAVDSLAQAQERLAGLLQAGDVVLFENDLPGHLER